MHSDHRLTGRTRFEFDLDPIVNCSPQAQMIETRLAIEAIAGQKHTSRPENTRIGELDECSRPVVGS